jgi:hypothetical protein
MSAEIYDADIHLADEYIGSVQLEFSTKDGVVDGLKIGNVKLDGDTAAAILDEIIYRSHQADRHDH